VQDRELADFYRGLFESEARHHTTYTRLAKDFAPDEVVMARLEELAALEAAIIDHGGDQPRMHS
jgi:tRNA-(ms[2]io[6]A)-hydroxylase